MSRTLGTVPRGRYTPLNAESQKNPERLTALRGQTGATWFVDSGVAGGSSGNGLSWTGAFLTVAEAIDKALANDLILINAGHAESTITTAITQSVAGVQIVGLGLGDRRPTFTFTADVNWNLDAAGLLLENLNFKVGIDSLAIIIDINSTDCAVRYCDFEEGSSLQWLTAIDLNGGSGNACDNCEIIGNTFTSISAGAATAIGLDAVMDSVIIADNLIDGDFSDAGIHNPSGSVLTNLRLENNIVRNRNAGDHAVELVSACTGMAVDNRFFSDTTGVVYDPGSLFNAGNLECSAIDSVGGPSPSGGDYNPVLGYRVQKTEDGSTATKDVLFTITGLVLITSWIGQVTNALGATAKYSDYVLEIDGAGDLAASTDISSAAIGYTFQLGGDAGLTLPVKLVLLVQVDEILFPELQLRQSELVGPFLAFGCEFVDFGVGLLQISKGVDRCERRVDHTLHH